MRRKQEPYIPRSPKTLEDGLENHIKSAISGSTQPKTLEEAFEDVWKKEDGIEDEEEEEEMRIFLNPHRES